MVKLNEVLFSDIYITPDKIAYIPDNVTPNGLEVLEAEDFDDFFDLIEQSWDGNNPSYSVMFDEIFLSRGTNGFHLRHSILRP